ncbi:MAG TPA: prolyl oligopeptidase family serine peptidase [Candidatus Limnocylindrales bacterium]
MAPKIAPYGSWPSSITVDALLVDRIIAHEPRIDGQTIAWLEGRPSERGRSVVVRAVEGGGVEELTPAGSDVHDGVHEYGGGAWAIDDGIVYYSERSDDRLYRIAFGAAAAGGTPEAITPAGGMRFADFTIDRRRSRLIAVREEHRGDGPQINDVVAIPLGPAGADPAAPIVLVEGADFYGPLALSPDGDRLAWLTWQLPDMPWDGSELWVADLNAEGRPTGARRVAGSRSESIAEPRWSPDGRLHFVSDRTDWWNLYRHEADRSITALAPLETEFAGPQWVFGLSTYGFANDGSIVAVSHDHATDRLWRILPDGAPRAITLPYLEIGGLAVAGDRIVIVGGMPSEPDHVASVTDEERGATIDILRRTSPVAFDPASVAIPEPIDFPTEGGRTAHALFYRPTNPDFVGPADERPPLVVRSHGGPTAGTGQGFFGSIQYLVSRGIAVVDVDYGGSTGYGRDYRSRLDGEWGVVDVDDCLNAGRYLASIGEADPARMACEGGSASGYTTLAMLAFRPGAMAAGVSYFGIGDLTGFDLTTHKFESRYTERLVGPLPETEALWRERSPILHAERISVPMLILQGLDDKVVPPSQAEQIVAGLAAKGIPHAYLAYEGEGHGFRKLENIRRSYQAELSFYGQVFGFTPADELPPLELLRG